MYILCNVLIIKHGSWILTSASISKECFAIVLVSCVAFLHKGVAYYLCLTAALRGNPMCSANYWTLSWVRAAGSSLVKSGELGRGRVGGPVLSGGNACAVTGFDLGSGGFGSW